MKMYGEMEVKPREWSASYPGCFILRRLGGARASMNIVEREKSFALARIESQPSSLLLLDIARGNI
jgi:hypothetical protein